MGPSVQASRSRMMTDTEIRERAYAVVKRMKAAFTKEGCDWQLAIEAELRSVISSNHTKEPK